MAKIAPFGRYRAFDADGNPLSGGKLYTYEAGTTTPKVTYTDSSEGTANTNPVIMDADGYCDVWLGVGGYKFVLTDANDVTQWTKDDIDGGGAAGYANQVISRSSGFNLTVNEQNTAIVCTAPLTVSLLPSATAGDGFVSVIINVSSGYVTIDPDGSETIDGAASLVIPSMSSATIACNSLAWYSFGYTRSIKSGDFRVVDSGDATKKLAFNTATIATGNTRTVTIPNANLTMVGTDTAQTLTNKTFDSTSNFTGVVTVTGTSSSAASITLAEDTDNGTNKVTVIAPASLASDVTSTLPTTTGTLANRSKFAYLSYQVSAGTGGGTATADAWTVRQLNTESDPDGIVTLSSNQFTVVTTGTYIVGAIGQFYSDANRIGILKQRIRNVTDSTTVLLSITGGLGFPSGSSGNVPVIIPQQAVTLTTGKTYELQYYCDYTGSAGDLGYAYANAASGEAEVYAHVSLQLLT